MKRTSPEARVGSFASILFTLEVRVGDEQQYEASSVILLVSHKVGMARLYWGVRLRALG